MEREGIKVGHWVFAPWDGREGEPLCLYFNAYDDYRYGECVFQADDSDTLRLWAEQLAQLAEKVREAGY
jgi:hypothetical protein